MNGQAPHLFDLLPAVHRVRDADRGYPLRSLLGAMQDELDLLHEDVEQLYDNWFIETCEDWVVPYIGDLLGVRGLLDVTGTRFSPRGLVANTIAYRRRKGTVAVIEQLAHDVTGWPAKAVEFFQLLGWTQNYNHVRLGAGGTASVRDGDAMELVGGPFDSAAHTAEVRHIDNARGRFDIPNVGVFLWRLSSYTLERATALADPAHAGRYTLNPLGLDAPLFNHPHTERDIEHLATELDVPGPLRRRPLDAELRAEVPADVEHDDGVERFFAPENPPFAVWFGPGRQDPNDIAICNLDDPARLAPAGKKLAIDPLSGRAALGPGVAAPAELRVSWAYGFAGDMGGGPYDRRESLAAALGRERVPDWQAGVVGDPPAGLHGTLTGAGGALTDWAGLAPRPALSLIVVMDSRTYAEPLEIEVPADCTLVLAAAKWDEEEDPITLVKARLEGHQSADGVRPHLRGDVKITGAGAGSSVVLDGLLIEGQVTVADGQLTALRIAHCTVAPGSGGITVGRNVDLSVDIERSISGAVAIDGSAGSVSIRDSILDGGGGVALTAPATAIDRSTLLGSASLRSVGASDCIFTAPVLVERRQTGCVRYSYVPLESRVPRRFRCRPADAAEADTLFPEFTSVRYGDPGYGQLAADTPGAIARGGDAEGEMGAFAFVQAPYRLANLRARLDEYLRFGLEAGTFFAT